MRPPVAHCVVWLVTMISGISAAEISGDLLTPFSWREIGPTSTGGRIVDLAVDPVRSSTIYVASAAGGLWKSTNRGTTWSCVFQNEGTTSIGDIAIDPNDSKTVWIGTGEANNQRSSYWGDGVYKSTDGGATWTPPAALNSAAGWDVLVDWRARVATDGLGNSSSCPSAWRSNCINTRFHIST